LLEFKKQNTDTQAKRFDAGMLRAHSQTDGYVRALPAPRVGHPFCWWSMWAP
jgi:hypothetical protein